MENRSVSQNDFTIPQTELSEPITTDSLSSAEMHSLIEFFELLDRWDRQVVQ